MIEIALTQTLPITATLFDGNQVKYLRARVFDNAFSEVAGSPFTLSHIQNGTYRNTSFTPASEGVFVAIVEVFDDTGFTTASIDYTQGQDIYLVTDREQRIEDIDENIDSNEGRAI